MLSKLSFRVTVMVVFAVSAMSLSYAVDKDAQAKDVSSCAKLPK